MNDKDTVRPETNEEHDGETPSSDEDVVSSEPEIGGRKGPDPTRFGDWEKNGRCIDF